MVEIRGGVLRMGLGFVEILKMVYLWGMGLGMGFIRIELSVFSMA